MTDPETLGRRLTERLNTADRDVSFADSEPKDASTLILIDRAGPEPKVLMGRRHAGHKFMAGKFVFPGGRIEPDDHTMPAASELHADAQAKLLLCVEAPSPTTARAMALAAIRETYEETGLLLGVQQDDPPFVPSANWTAFLDARVHPDLADIHFIARAITPPNRPKRFDTRFFTADATAVAHRIDGIVGPDAELVELVWVPIDEAVNLDLPAITAVALEELDARVEAGMRHDLPVPFYVMVDGKFRRELL